VADEGKGSEAMVVTVKKRLDKVVKLHSKNEVMQA